MDKEQQLTPEEKHEIWMKNSGYLYDRLVVHPLKWPSLTFQWLPTFRETLNSTIYQCIFSTHSSGKKPIQHIYMAEVQLPHHKFMDDPEPQINPSSIRKIQEFSHEIQVNKARVCDENPDLVAARVEGGPIAIFKKGKQYPELLLSDITLGGGFALDWSAGLLAGDQDGNIAYWENVESKPIILKSDCSVEDTKFFDDNTFSTVGVDGKINLWDKRTEKIALGFRVSEKQVYCNAVNPQNRCLILTGGEDTNINLWDLRNYEQKLYKFESHESSVTSLSWSPKSPTIFASGSQDCKVKIWDLLRVGFQIPKDNSGTDELLFTHEGHLGEVTDLSWNPFCMMLGSTQEIGNSLQFYQISNCIQDLEYAEDIQYLKRHCLA